MTEDEAEAAEVKLKLYFSQVCVLLRFLSKLINHIILMIF